MWNTSRVNVSYFIAGYTDLSFLSANTRTDRQCGRSWQKYYPEVHLILALLNSEAALPVIDLFTS